MIKIQNLVLLGLLVLLLSACTQAPVATQNPTGAQTAAPPSSPAPASEVAAVVESTPGEEVDYCLACHSDQQQLMDSALPQEATLAGNIGAAFGTTLTPMEPWQKVLVNATEFPGSVHGLQGCIACHGGQQSPDKEVAHTGVVRAPSKDAAATCGSCHPDVVAHDATSLHSNLTGFWTALEARSLPKSHPVLQQALADQCSSCHTTCGDCHISQPATVGGGLVNEHVFSREPTMTQTCTACHGSRVGDEFLGNHAGLAADIHFSQGEMDCMDCHSSSELHGQTAQCSSCHEGPQEAAVVPPPDHRYAGVQSPRCETCHVTVSTGQDDVIMHQMHGGDLSCQVCHSIAYTSCDGCHVSVDSQTGLASFETAATYFTFLIGRNPMRSYDRPYEFVPVRHVPITSTTFDFYGANLLQNFDNVETWKYTTPHNIQRNTPQTASCNTCHGNPDLFLTADKVAPEELNANRNVIVEAPPPPITSGDQIP